MSGITTDIKGYNLFVYCFNNPVNMVDYTGNWPEWFEKALEWTDENVVTPAKNFMDDVKEDIEAYDTSNTDAKRVLESNYFSNYNDTFVIRIPTGNAFSFGIIFLGKEVTRDWVVNHEYGHKVQLDQMGVLNYATEIALPSVTAFLVDINGNLPFDYYSSPWEAGADYYGGVERNSFNDPWSEEDGKYKYLINIFLK